MEERVCKWCNRPFTIKKRNGTNRVKYCSDTCRYEGKKFLMRERNRRVDQKLKLEIKTDKKLQKELLKNIESIYKYFLKNCLAMEPFKGIQCISICIGDKSKGETLYWKLRERYRQEYV